MPLWLLVSLLQLFIPLNILMKSCCIEEVEHHWIHWLSSLIIFIGCVVNSLTLQDNPADESDNDFREYSIMVVISAVIDVISHTIKEVLVRTQPLNQERFNYTVSMFQFFFSLFFLPFITLTRS
mmetsp:Transcript_14262/g.24261  ORF Transcript_14262/g.24261 Transcript_14262/m.24261 type:complete len:124 (+) Transcript_14262:437-808(+)